MLNGKVKLSVKMPGPDITYSLIISGPFFKMVNRVEYQLYIIIVFPRLVNLNTEIREKKPETRRMRSKNMHDGSMMINRSSVPHHRVSLRTLMVGVIIIILRAIKPAVITVSLPV